MTTDMELLREWVLAEIDYALAQREEDDSGYRSSAHSERDFARALFDKLCQPLPDYRDGYHNDPMTFRK